MPARLLALVDLLPPRPDVRLHGAPGRLRRHPDLRVRGLNALDLDEP